MMVIPLFFVYYKRIHSRLIARSGTNWRSIVFMEKEYDSFINGYNGKNDREEISAKTTPQQKEKAISEILSS
jgi:hypothetical protein